MTQWQRNLSRSSIWTVARDTRRRSDQLWQGLTRPPSRSIRLLQRRGRARAHRAIRTPGGVRNLESQGRQHYARNLYCLMLLLMDENYIAPWDENDPQIMAWMDAEKKKLTSRQLSMPRRSGGHHRQAQAHLPA